MNPVTLMGKDADGNCKVHEEISSQEESCCEGLELQADDVSLQVAGIQSSAFLMMSRSGHSVTSALCHCSAGLEGINTGPASQGDNSSVIIALNTSHSLSLQPATADTSTTKAKISHAFVVKERGDKNP